MAETEQAEAALAKEEGNTAFKNEDYEKAIQHYSKAISLGHDNIHAIYSNRSAAKCKLNNFEAALIDAQKCVELEPTYSKGFSRLGSAYHGLQQFKEATEAYTNGLKLAPDNQFMKTELEVVKRAEEASKKPKPSTTGAATKFYSNFLVVLCTFVAMVPFVPRPIYMGAYKLGISVALSTYLQQLIATYGFGLQLVKDPRVRKNDNTHYLYLCVLLLVWPPLPFALVPIAACAFHACLGRIRTMLAACPASMRSMLESKFEQLDTPQGQVIIPHFAAVSELMVGIMLIVSLAGGLKNVIMLLLYWQFLSWRYVNSQWSKHAFWAMREKLDGVFNHRFCPSPFRMLYDRVKQFMGAYVRHSSRTA